MYDISLGVVDGGVHYPGNPAIRVTPWQRVAEGASANVSRLDLGSHTGTHVDAPRAQDVEGAVGDGAARVLLRTRNSAFVAGPAFREDLSFLAPDGAEYLAGLGAELVGIGYFTIDQFHSGHHGAHKARFAAGAVIVEGLALAEVPAGRYELVCLPLKLVGLDGAPARAVLIGDPS
jgi:arylformamidase